MTPSAPTTQQPTSAAPAPSEARKELLLGQLAFSHDPFIHAVAELELVHQPEHFFAYVDTGEEQLIGTLARLEEARHSIVFGPRGSGKSTLRLNLARTLAKHQPGVFSVTCDLSQLSVFDAGAFEEYVAREMAKDLLLFLLRRSGGSGPHAPAAGRAAPQLAAWLIQSEEFRRPLRRVLESPDGAVLDSLVATLGRKEIPPEVSSPALRAFFKTLSELRLPDQSGSHLPLAWRAAKEISFRSVYLLVDGADEHDRTPDDMMKLVQHFHAIARRLPGRVCLKLFLPADLESRVLAGLDSLSAPCDVMHLAWSPEQLAVALLHRLHTARGDVSSLDDASDLFEESQGRRVIAEMIEAAGRSPRRLVQLFSATIDAHISSNTPATRLTYSDWQAGRRSVAVA